MANAKDYTLNKDKFIKIDVIRLNGKKVTCNLCTGVGAYEITMDRHSYDELCLQGFFNSGQGQQTSPEAINGSEVYTLKNGMLTG
jgi:hypothetical protein